MAKIINSVLLQDKDILSEINKYKWYESEKAREDIGFEKASREWINRYSKQYLASHPNKTALLWLKSNPIINFLNKEINFD